MQKEVFNSAEVKNSAKGSKLLPFTELILELIPFANFALSPVLTISGGTYYYYQIREGSAVHECDSYMQRYSKCLHSKLNSRKIANID